MVIVVVVTMVCVCVYVWWQTLLWQKTLGHILERASPVHSGRGHKCKVPEVGAHQLYSVSTKEAGAAEAESAEGRVGDETAEEVGC